MVHVRAVYRSAKARTAGHASGAIAAQLSQAMASFVLQVIVARTLGAKGLGAFALIYGAIILGTALCTGLVGDSLTVLDRNTPTIRAGLQWWCAIAATSSGLLAVGMAGAMGVLSWRAATLFGLATVVFVIEDTLRRMLMAVFRFWSLPLVDTTSLVGSVAVIVAASSTGNRLTLGTFMLALLIGQVAAAAVAALRLPREERRLGPLRVGEMAVVFRFGVWRSAAQSVRPLTLNAVRIVLTAAVGIALYGQLEGARVYMAPALLVVNGVGSFLLPLYVRHRESGVRALLRRADIAACGLLCAALALGAVATAALPSLGPAVVGNRIHLSPLAVAGWSVYAASCAAIMPFGSLAAALGKAAQTMTYRVVELAVSVGAVALFATSPGRMNVAPLLMALGPLVGGLCIRNLLLAPMARPAEAQSRRGGRHRADSRARTTVQSSFGPGRVESSGNGDAVWATRPSVLRTVN
jgi:O-antigen/teichoic acid export membrane protein